MNHTKDDVALIVREEGGKYELPGDDAMDQPIQILKDGRVYDQFLPDYYARLGKEVPPYTGGIFDPHKISEWEEKLKKGKS